jgi:hypothetical protein
VVAPDRKELPNAPYAMKHSVFVSGTVAEMLSVGAVTLLPRGQKPLVVSPLGVVSKPHTNKYRLSVNLRYVNRRFRKKIFKFEGWKDLADLSERGGHAVSYDLMPGYYHVGVHPGSMTFIGFFWEGRYCVYNCLPFGLSTTSWFFSKSMREFMMNWRRGGIRVLPYLDDVRFMMRGFWQYVRLARKVERDFVRAGLKINVPKCSLVLEQQIRQLGFDVDFEAGKFHVPKDRCEAPRASVKEILASRHGKVQARSLASVTGTVILMHLS